MFKVYHFPSLSTTTEVKPESHCSVLLSIIKEARLWGCASVTHTILCSVWHYQVKAWWKQIHILTAVDILTVLSICYYLSRSKSVFFLPGDLITKPMKTQSFPFSITATIITSVELNNLRLWLQTKRLEWGYCSFFCFVQDISWTSHWGGVGAISKSGMVKIIGDTKGPGLAHMPEVLQHYDGSALYISREDWVLNRQALVQESPKAGQTAEVFHWGSLENEERQQIGCKRNWHSATDTEKVRWQCFNRNGTKKRSTS